MQVGIYFGKHSDDNFAPKSNFAGDVKVFGYSSVENEPNKNIPFAFIPDYAELLAASDVLLVVAGQSDCYSIAVDAIRKGIHVFYSDLSQLSLQNLIDIRNLLQEIDVKVSFGYSGFNVIDHLPVSKSIENAIFVDCKRSVQQVNRQLQFHKILTFDLASLLRLSTSAVRKVRISAFPVNEASFRLLNLRLELNDGSIYCYTLADNLAPESYSLTLYSDQQTDLPCYSSNESFANFAQNTLADNVLYFASQVDNRCPQFTIERAIDLHRLLQGIFDKLSF
ncbi:MAG: hypothetical protein PHD06_07855 [Bacteroidales bacterium]|jgi:hypothetical protein|nr:hypothetical protein [Bacteroidales bacterium]MDD4385079.1 hypothetical protein [Bacteroidales bacterium]MDY0196390.1 hypothetical protein [Tenuifilaceae bacterium]